MAWENLLKKGMDIFSEENTGKDAVNFLLKNAINPFPSYYFIFNCETSEIEYTSPDITRVLGYEPNEFNIQLLLEYIHPEDHTIFIQHETKALEFCRQLAPELQDKYYVIHDFRMKTKTGASVRIQQRSYACEIRNNVLKKTMVIHSDISQLKNHQEAELHFIGINGETSYLNVHRELEKKITFINKLFSKKEIEILRYMVQGIKSEDIAQLTDRSIFTIRNHRKKILKKSGCNNVQELLVKAVQEGWA